MNGRRVGFSGSTVRRLTPVRGFYYDVLGFPGYKRYIGASSTYMAASSFLLIRPPSRSFTSPSLQLPARFSFVDFRASVVLRNTRVLLVFSLLLFGGKGESSLMILDQVGSRWTRFAEFSPKFGEKGSRKGGRRREKIKL